jgi:hypothetical protein
VVQSIFETGVKSENREVFVWAVMTAAKDKLDYREHDMELEALGNEMAHAILAHE